MSDRTVHTDALETLGTIIGPDEARDAIHLAVEPVAASERLFPGQDVGLLPDGTASTKAAKLVGIVDPFLKSAVFPGERFWLVVYPRQITSLRHVWAHPDFDNLDVIHDSTVTQEDLEKNESRQWIESYADKLNKGWSDYYETDYGTSKVTADDLIKYASTWADEDEFLPNIHGGDYLVRAGLLEGVSTDPEFWYHFEKVTGKTVSEPQNFFSCSC